MPSRTFLPVVAGTVLILTLFFAAVAGAQEETTNATADPATTAEATAEDATADATAADNANREGSFRCETFLRVVRDENGALRAQYSDDELIVQRFEQCLEGDVLRNTIPNRLLPDTGGAPLLGLAALGLASLVAGASVLGAIARRGR